MSEKRGKNYIFGFIGGEDLRQRLQDHRQLHGIMKESEQLRRLVHEALTAAGFPPAPAPQPRPARSGVTH